MDDDILELKRLVFELTLSSSSCRDLDHMLERVFHMLDGFSRLHVKREGAILLYNHERQPIQVAQYGIPSPWLPSFDWSVLRSDDPALQSGVTLRYCNALRGDRQGGPSSEKPFLALPLIDNGRCLGHAALFLNTMELPSAANMEILGDLARAVSGFVGRYLLDEIVKVREWELEESRTDAIHRLGAASEYRDSDTGWHVVRMTNYALAIARQMRLPDEQRDVLSITAPMHDVGKIGIPDAILLKPGRLTDDEREIMHRHAEIGEVILKGNDALTSAARDIAVSHHERWDGSGYPRRLKGEEIPVLARICAVADVFDALTTVRPYKEAWPLQEALDLISDEAGKHFDPAVVTAFFAALPEIRRIRELYRDDIIDPSEVLPLPPPVGGQDNWVTWDPSFSVGIDVIDEHHRYLLDLVNDIHRVVINKRGARELAKVIKALDLYAKVHFRAEERMMAHCNFPGTERQKRQHERFEQRLQEFHEELHANPLTTQYDLLEFARSWLVGHILHEDTQLRALVR